MRWPWQAAIYRTANGVKESSLRKGAWILICSGALVNERTVVVAAHCVTDLGKTIVLKTGELKVVLGKFYRDDDRDEKTIQNLRVSNPDRSEKWWAEVDDDHICLVWGEKGHLLGSALSYILFFEIKI